MMIVVGGFVLECFEFLHVDFSIVDVDFELHIQVGSLYILAFSCPLIKEWAEVAETEWCSVVFVVQSVKQSVIFVAAHVDCAFHVGTWVLWQVKGHIEHLNV